MNLIERIRDQYPPRFSWESLAWLVLLVGSAWRLHLNWEPWQLERILKTDANFASFSPDGERVVTMKGASNTHIWEVSTGAELHTWKGHDDFIVASSYSPDGKFSTGAAEGYAVTISDRNGKDLNILKGHTDILTGVYFSPDGKRIISSSFDHTARIWDVNNAAALHTLNGHSNVVSSALFSPDCLRIVTSSHDGTVRIWHNVRSEGWKGYFELPESWLTLMFIVLLLKSIFLKSTKS